MKDIKELTKDNIKDTKLIVFDVDGVLVPRGTKIKQQGNKLSMEFKQINIEYVDKLRELSKYFKINISSGRGLYLLQDMFRDIIDCVSITYENGSATYDYGIISQYINSIELNELRNDLSKIKDDNILGFEPKEFIITIHCKDRVLEIEEYMKEKKQYYLLWNGEAYDIGIIRRQDKGYGLFCLKHSLELKSPNVLAIGDNLNDQQLLQQSGIRVTADETKLLGDFSIPLNEKKLPGEVLIDKLLDLVKTTKKEVKK